MFVSRMTSNLQKVQNLIVSILHYFWGKYLRNKGNNKITELRTIFQREKAKPISTQTDIISQQPENWENHNDPDLVQAFPKKWWVESDFTAPNIPLSLRLKGSGCHYNNILNNTGTNVLRSCNQIFHFINISIPKMFFSIFKFLSYSTCKMVNREVISIFFVKCLMQKYIFDPHR